MSTETPPAQVAPAVTELSTDAVAAPADGVTAPESQQDDGQPDPSAPEGDGGKETPEHRKPQYRFNQMAADRNKAREEAAYWRGIAEAAQRGQNAQPAPPAPAPAQPEADPEPNPNDFDGEFGSQYLRAVARWEGRQEARKIRDDERKAADTERTQTQEREAIAAGQQRYHAAIEAVDSIAEEFPQYADAASKMFSALNVEAGQRKDTSVLDALTATHNPQWVAAAIATEMVTLDDGREIPRHQYFRSLSRTEQVLEIGRLDWRIAQTLRQSDQPAKPAAKPPAATATPNAPAPPPQAQPATATLNGRGAVLSFNPNGSVEEYIAWRKSMET